MLVLLCCLLAILTSRKSKHNQIRNFSESTVSQKTKLAAQFTEILKFLNIIKSILGKIDFLVMGVEDTRGKLQKIAKLEILRALVFGSSRL